MTDNEFELVMVGQGGRHVGVGREQTRLRYIVADAFSDRARERYKDGRPDKGSLCSYVAGELRTGGYPSKRVKSKAASDIRVVRERLVDGVSLSGL